MTDEEHLKIRTTCKAAISDIEHVIKDVQNLNVLLAGCHADDLFKVLEHLDLANENLKSIRRD